MYFESRAEAGEKLASELFEKYRFEDCAVVALNDGGILVGEPVAARLHSVLAMIVSEDIEIPGESLMIGGVSQMAILCAIHLWLRANLRAIKMSFLAILSS